MTERRHDELGRIGVESGRGVVAAFDVETGLGEIAADSGERLPFHCIEIADGTRDIPVGAGVGFGIVTKLGRREAVTIRP